MKFKFNDRVLIKKEFYSGLKGLVKNYRLLQLNDFTRADYEVHFENEERWFHEDDLELLEGATAGASG